jgi:hypothetical protein
MCAVAIAIYFFAAFFVLFFALFCPIFLLRFEVFFVVPASFVVCCARGGLV